MRFCFREKRKEYGEGAALALPLGCKVHPRPRRLRTLHDLLTKQLPAAAAKTHTAVSGQASFAGRAVRKAHSEKPRDLPKIK